MRWLFVIRFRDQDGNTQTCQTVANSPKAAAKRMRKKHARIMSVRKKKRV